MDGETLRLFREGNPLPPRENGRQHIGLANIRERISFLYGAGYGMEIFSGGSFPERKGTRVELTLPLLGGENERC